MSILVIDVGTSSVRAAIVDPDATVRFDIRQQLLPDTPFAGLVEFDATTMAAVVLEAAGAACAQAGDVEAVAIANQRASTIVWDRVTGEPVGPGLSWQDLRTVGDCLTLAAEGIVLAPNQSATKAAHLLDQADPNRERDLVIGTVDTWVAWTLSEGDLHITEPSNVYLTGLTDVDGEWSDRTLDRLRISRSALPTVVDSTQVVGAASALPGAPPLAGILGDQQSSLVGQGCVRPGMAKMTFGTGGMIDVCTGADRITNARRTDNGTFAMAAWSQDAQTTWGLEGIMLTAGTNVEWLRDDLGLISTAAESHDLASTVADTEGVSYVPALLGLATPYWDFGARGALFGLTRGTTSAHVVRAVLEGVAHLAADTVEAVVADTGLDLPTLRVDGGMSANPTFIQALADATQRPIEVAAEADSTSLGAAFCAGLAIGTWSGWDDIAATWRPRITVEPGPETDRDRWRVAVERAQGWYPDLSSLDL